MEKNLKVALILSAVDKASMVVGRVFTGAEKGAKRLASMSTSLGMLGTQGIVAGGAITAFFGKALKDANEATKANRVLNASFANLGEAGKQAAEDGKKFAEAYQFKIGVNAEEIQAAETRLGVFHKLFNKNAQDAKIFERATKAAFDMKALGFGDDAASNAAKLGKLLNDPLNNMNALGKILGKMNPEQKKHIKNLYEQNKVTQAQSYVLEMVEKRFRNAAESSASGGDKMKVSLRAINVEIGQKLQPAYRQLLATVNEYLPKVLAFVKTHQGIIVTVAKAAVALLLFSSGIKILSFAFSGIAAIAKISSAVITNFGTIVSIGSKTAGIAVKGYEAMKFGLFALQYQMKFAVIPAIQKAGIAFMEFGATLLANPLTWYIAAAVALGAAVYLIIKNWDKISAFFVRLWSGVKQVFSSTWQWLKGMFLNYTPYGLVIKHWDKISGMFGQVWKKVKNVFRSAFDWMKGLGKTFFDAGKNIVLSIGNGIAAMAMKPVEAMKNMVTKMRRFLPFSPAKEGPLKDIHRIKLVETIAQSINAKPLLNAWSNVTGKLYGQMNHPIPAFANNSGGGSGMTINISVNLSGSATQKDADMLGDSLKKQFDKWYKENQRQQGRISF